MAGHALFPRMPPGVLGGAAPLGRGLGGLEGTWPRCPLCSGAGHLATHCALRHDSARLQREHDRRLSELHALGAGGWGALGDYDQRLQHLAMLRGFLEWARADEQPTPPAPAQPPQLLCPHASCPTVTASLRDFAKHIKAHGRPPGPLRCPVGGCATVYQQGGRLVTHLRTQHQLPWAANSDSEASSEDSGSDSEPPVDSTRDSLPFRCPAQGCARAFSLARALTRHTKGHFKAGGPVLCGAKGCGLAFTELRALQAHAATHTAAATVASAVAHHPATQAGTHTATYTPITGPGLEVARARATPDEVSSTEEATDGLHVCQVSGCGFSFPTPRILHAHVRLHTAAQGVHVVVKEEAVRCSHPGCTELFGSSGQLRKHVWVHRRDRARTAHKRPAKQQKA